MGVELKLGQPEDSSGDPRTGGPRRGPVGHLPAWPGEAPLHSRGRRPVRSLRKEEAACCSHPDRCIPRAGLSVEDLVPCGAESGPQRSCGRPAPHGADVTVSTCHHPALPLPAAPEPTSMGTEAQLSGPEELGLQGPSPCQAGSLGTSRWPRPRPLGRVELDSEGLCRYTCSHQSEGRVLCPVRRRGQRGE